MKFDCIFAFVAKKFGCTDFINPKNLSRPITEELIDRLDGGADYTFECVGNVKTMVNPNRIFRHLLLFNRCTEILINSDLGITAGSS